jgi:hypothetical protein
MTILVLETLHILKSMLSRMCSSPRPYRPFAGGSRAAIRSLRSPTFTCNGSFAIFFPCRQAAAFLAQQQHRSARHPPLRCGPRLQAGRCGAH